MQRRDNVWLDRSKAQNRLFMKPQTRATMEVLLILFAVNPALKTMKRQDVLLPSPPTRNATKTERKGYDDRSPEENSGGGRVGLSDTLCVP